jgi:threonylcarbamoyladenosine tRNA methylthiotransferase MtaB
MFAAKVSTINQIIPNALIGVDVIVGVRGETEKLFEQALLFIKSLNIAQLHVFSYSERAGTKMLEINHSVSNQERKRRSDVLHKLSDEKTEVFYNAQLGKIAHVLWESRHKDENMVGFTENYIRIERTYDKNLVNTIHTVSLGEWNEDKTALKIAP